MCHSLRISSCNRLLLQHPDSSSCRPDCQPCTGASKEVAPFERPEPYPGQAYHCLAWLSSSQCPVQTTENGLPSTGHFCSSCCCFSARSQCRHHCISRSTSILSMATCVPAIKATKIPKSECYGCNGGLASRENRQYGSCCNSQEASTCNGLGIWRKGAAVEALEGVCKGVKKY